MKLEIIKTSPEEMNMKIYMIVLKLLKRKMH